MSNFGQKNTYIFNKYFFLSLGLDYLGGVVLDDHVYDLSLKETCHRLESESSVEFYIWMWFMLECLSICLDDLRLSSVDELLLIIPSHLFTVWSIDNSIDKMKSKKCSFSFCFLS